jgi:hypothetical protein
LEPLGGVPAALVHRVWQNDVAQVPGGLAEHPCHSVPIDGLFGIVGLLHSGGSVAAYIFGDLHPPMLSPAVVDTCVVEGLSQVAAHAVVVFRIPHPNPSRAILYKPHEHHSYEVIAILDLASPQARSSASKRLKFFEQAPGRPISRRVQAWLAGERGDSAKGLQQGRHGYVAWIDS